MRLILFFFLLICQQAFTQPVYEEWFGDGRLRVDFVLAGNAGEANFYVSQYYHEPLWSGSKVNLIDTMNYGNYYFVVSDALSGKKLYSRGFNTLFGEWQTVEEAKKENRAFRQSLFFPFPLNKVRLEVFQQLSVENSKLLYRSEIDPQNMLIKGPVKNDFGQKDIFISGPSDKKVDLLFVAEGYREEEMDAFLDHVNTFTSALFQKEPFKSYRDHFNIRALLSPSPESGTDIPGEDVWKNTLFSSHFYTFGTERYLTTEDYWSICDAASQSAFDHLIVLVNTSRYGGGGIYNYYSLFSAGNDYSPEVFVHELGHGFGGLGDEYYSSEVSYSGFYPTDTEPIVPNLTSLVDFSSKWKDLVDEDTPIPTPPLEKYHDVVGAFEGGGYVSQGIYRPEIDCLMKSNEAGKFCRVCHRALVQMIEFYSR